MSSDRHHDDEEAAVKRVAGAVRDGRVRVTPRFRQTIVELEVEIDLRANVDPHLTSPGAPPVR